MIITTINHARCQVEIREYLTIKQFRGIIMKEGDRLLFMEMKRIWYIGRHFVYVIGAVALARILLHLFASQQIIHFFAIELHLVIAGLIVGVVVGERGWLYGLVIALLNILYFLIVVRPVSPLNFMATMVTTRLSAVTFQIIAGITGGLLGGLINVVFRYIDTKRGRGVSVAVLILLLLFFLGVVPFVISRLRVESLLYAPRIVALFDILLVAIIIIINVSLAKREGKGAT